MACLGILHRPVVCAVAMVGVVAGAVAAAASSPPDEPRVSVVPRSPGARRSNTNRTASIRLDVKVIQIPVTVTDPRDRLVQGLQKGDFRLYEDNVEQKIEYVSSEEAPASVGLIFDSSGSMRNKIEAAVAAADEFLKTALPGDEFLMVQFADKPHLVSGFTGDPAEISGWLHAIRPDGWTALHDAIYLGLQKVRHSRNGRKALLILTDGGDNHSRYSAAEIRDAVRESDVRVYSIGLLIGFLQGSHLLERICYDTGGRMIPVRKLSELPEAINKLSRDLRSQYVLGYYPTNPQNDGKYRKVRVEVTQPDLRASWRRGYYAPGE